MQLDLVRAPIQPVLKLAQSNASLWASFWTSSEVRTELTAATAQWLQQVQQTAMKLAMTGAYASLSQGLLRNHMAFLQEWGQNAVAAAPHADAPLVEQTEQAIAELQGRVTRRRA